MPEGKIVSTVDDQLKSIGKVVIRWSMFELMLDMAIQDLSGLPPERGACITTQISGHSRKFDAIFSLIRLRDIEDIEQKLSKLKKIAERARRLGEERNRIVHDPWFGNMTGGLGRYQITARRSLVYQMKTGTEPELEKVASDTVRLSSDFAYALHELVPEVDLTPFS